MYCFGAIPITMQDENINSKNSSSEEKCTETYLYNNFYLQERKTSRDTCASGIKGKNIAVKEQLWQQSRCSR